MVVSLAHRQQAQRCQVQAMFRQPGDKGEPKVHRVEQALERGVSMSSNGRLIEIRVNGAILTALRTESAVAADYIGFMDAAVRALIDQKELEAEANKCGRTIATGFRGMGSFPLPSVSIPEVTDK